MNENGNVVRLLLPEYMVINLMGLIGNGITSEVCDDLGLDELHRTLSNHFGRTDLDEFDGLVRRADRDVPVAVVLRDSGPRYTAFDLT